MSNSLTFPHLVSSIVDVHRSLSDQVKHKLSCVDWRQLYRYLDLYRAYPQIVGSLNPQSALPTPGQLAAILPRSIQHDFEGENI
ncbi:MAG TPA: hypothetical protein EYO33_03030 [Phycisphaerales bacterium]|nr:hypothetical protein [Phycisphaerales bacterium]